MRSAMIHEAGGPEVIKIEEQPMPEPGEGQARIQVAYASLNPLDTHARALRVDWMHPGFPFVPGYEYAGRVDAVGNGVDESLLGQRVAVHSQWSGNADYALADASRLQTVPEEFNWATAASFSTCAYTSWLLVHSAGNVQPGQVVVVHSAAGPVGALTTQVAKDAGATVVALAGGPAKLEYASQFGADHLVDYLQEDWPAQIMELTGGADLIIDGNAGPNALRNFECVKPLGNVIFMGATAGQAADINPSMLIGKSCSVTGFVQFFHQAVSGGREKTEMHAKLAAGEFRIPIGRIYPLEEVAEAHRAWENRELTGRALIEVGGEI